MQNRGRNGLVLELELANRPCDTDAIDAIDAIDAADEKEESAQRER